MIQRILLVDDEDTFRTSLSEALGDREDRLVHTAKDGIDALALLESTEVDLVVTDLQMPRMSGFDLIARMARSHPGVKTIVVTAYATPEMEYNFRMLRVAHYLDKPIDITVLSSLIDTALELPRPQQGAGTQDLEECLIRASTESLDGECVVCHGSEFGRLFTVQGKVAWVMASTARETLVTRIADETELSMSDLRGVFEECKRTQRNFGETLVEWALMTRQNLRQLLLEHLAHAFSHMASWPTTTVMFVQEKRHYDSSLLFGLAELVDAALRVSPQAPALLALARRLGIVGPASLVSPVPSFAAPAPALHLPQSVEGVPMPLSENERRVSQDTCTALESLSVVDGFVGTAAFTADGQVIAHVGGTGADVSFAELGALACSVLLAAQEATEIMGIGRGNQIHVQSAGAHIVTRCIEQSTDCVVSDAGSAVAFALLVLEGEANVALGKMRLEKVAYRLAPLMRQVR